MIRYLGPGGLIMLALWIYAVFDVIATDEILVRNLPKTLWLILVLFVGPIGSIAWLILGRPQYAGWAPGGNASTAPPASRQRTGPRGVEDDLGWSPPRASEPPTPAVDADAFARWEDDLARREAALREPAPVDKRPATEPVALAPKPEAPTPRWWSAVVAAPVHDVVVGNGIVIVPGPDRVTAFDAATGAQRWISDPIADDGAGTVEVRGETIAYWTSGDSVLLDALTGAVIAPLDEAPPEPADREVRVRCNRWSMECVAEHLGVRTPDGRRWVIVGSVEPVVAPVATDDWLYGVAPDGRIVAVDTGVKTPVTAVQQLGFVLR